MKEFFAAGSDQPLLTDPGLSGGTARDHRLRFFYSCVFGRLTNGFLADHANIKRFFPAGLLVSAVINIAMGGFDWFWLWIMLWGLNGWFQGFGSPACAVAMTHWFSITISAGRSWTSILSLILAGTLWRVKIAD